MANKRITDLPAVTSPDGDASVAPVVSGGITSKCTLRNAVRAGLSPATTTAVGGVKVGTGLTVDVNGLLSASASQSLAGLSDTDISNPQTGHLLQYQSSTSKWSNENYIDGGNY